MPKGQWEPPEGGDLPAEGKRILKEVYSSCRDSQYDESPGSIEDPEKKASCARIAWSAVEKAGYKKNAEGKWIKEEKKKEPEDESIQEQLKQRSKIHKDKPIIEETRLTEVESLGDHKYRVQIINLELPFVEKRGWSLNERYYSDPALNDLARLINGKPLIASGHHRAHPEFSDMAGMYSEGRKVPGKKIVTAVAEVIGVAQETVEPFVQKQVSDPQAKLLSLSHNSKGDTYWGTDPLNRKGNIVKNINEVFSTDIVFLPGAGGNFQKIAEEYRRKKMIDITKKELKEENPELYKEIQEEALTESQKKEKELQEAKEKAEKELKTLKEEKEKAESKTSAEKLLKESKLNESQAKGLLESLVGKKEDEMKKLIEERKDYLRSLAKDLKVDNLSFDSKEETKEGKLTEAEKKMAKKLGVSEESFLKSKKLTESGLSLQESGISFAEEKK